MLQNNYTDTLQIELPDNLLVPDYGEPSIKFTLGLSRSELEQVKTALSNGRRTAEHRLGRTKDLVKRHCTGTDINNIDSVIYKADKCRPQTVYPLELHTSELEAVLYWLEHTKGSKSRERKELIKMIHTALNME